MVAVYVEEKSARECVGERERGGEREREREVLSVTIKP
jgi:hypothetical protein